jgi:glycosyltransferase involved in cell wall biosynthesis
MASEQKKAMAANRKVIFIITFCSKEAEFENQPAPKFQWTTPEGKTVGIWGLEWGDLLLKALADHYPDYDCEVWQPDLKADKQYTAQLQERLIHTNFPARMVKVFQRYKLIDEIQFKNIGEYISQNDNESTIFMFPTYVYYRWLNLAVQSVRRGRILYYNFLHPRLMLPQPIATINPLKACNYHLINMKKKAWLRRVDNLYSGYIEPEDLEMIKGINPDIRIFRRIFGMEPEKWVRDKTREQARKLLGIAPEHYVIVLSQRLVPEYQVDHFIEALSRVKTKRKISCYITGHGHRDYESYLNGIVRKVGLENAIKFIGFVSDEQLKDYLIAADLFATVARAFSGSGSAVKAMLVGTPVLHVSVSGTYQFLADNNAGIYVSPFDYGDWAEKLQALVDGLQVNTIDRELVVAQYSWNNTAQQLDNAINNLK